MHFLKLLFLGAQLSAEEVVKLVECEKVDLNTLQRAQDCINAAGNQETLLVLEELVTHWCKQVEQVKFKE